MAETIKDNMCDIIQSVQEQLSTLDTGVSSDMESNKELSDEPSFVNMPVEIILNICSYLDPYFLRNTLSKVCRRFADILADDHLWKHWVHSKIKGSFPALLDLKLLDEEDHLNWEDVCVDMDVEKRKWSNVEETMRHIVVKDVHFASVDTVLLVNKGEFCISGGRDRGMALWDVLDIIPKDQPDDTVTLTDAKPKHIRADAHEGWVWDLAADDINSASKVYSASWDNTVRVWDLEVGFKCVEVFNCKMTALSVVCVNNIVMAGLYSKKIMSFDSRAGQQPIHIYQPHKGPVLALQTYKNMVASISEDKTLAVWDRVAGKILRSDVKIPTEKAYPVCINWTPTALYLGDSKGSLHLMHPEKLAYVKTHEVWPEPPVIKPSSKITSCYQSSGNLILCSDRGEIKFFYNCYPPEEYVNIKTSTYDVTQMRYLNGVMVVGSCDSALEFWIPNERCLYKCTSV